MHDMALSPDPYGGEAKSINNAGIAVGGYGATAYNYDVAFRYSSGVVSTVPGLGQALAINAAGDIAGWGYGVSGYQRAFLLSGGSIKDLGTLGGTNSRALGMNDVGTVVGDAHLLLLPGGDPNAIVRAFMWKSGDMTQISPLIGDTLSEARAVNNHDQVVGISLDLGAYGSTTWDYKSFIYSAGTTTQLPALFGGNFTNVHDINDQGQVVGESGFTRPGSSGKRAAFLFQDGVTYDLNDLLEPGSGWTINGAAAINEFGQIAATGTRDGASVALLLTPVPEPTVEALLLVGLASLLVRRHQSALGNQVV